MKQILAHFLACLTQLILTKKQGFLDRRSIWCNKGDHDSWLIWPQNGFALWSSLSKVVPWKPHSQREIQTWGTLCTWHVVSMPLVQVQTSA